MISSEEINDFLALEFPQINGEYEILELSSENITICLLYTSPSPRD